MMQSEVIHIDRHQRHIDTAAKLVHEMHMSTITTKCAIQPEHLAKHHLDAIWGMGCKAKKHSQIEFAAEVFVGVPFPHLPLCISVTAGVGVTKAPFVNFTVSKIFDLAKVTVRFVESYSYLTGLCAAQLGRHLSNINVTSNS